MSNNKDIFGKKQGSLPIGAIVLVLSIIGLVWVQSHSPGNVGAWLTGGWVFKGIVYYVLLGFCLFFGAYGIINLIRGLKSQKDGSATIQSEEAEGETNEILIEGQQITENKPALFYLLFQWLVGVVFLIIGIVLIFTKFVAGAFSFAVSIIMLPPLAKQLDKRLNIRLNKKLKTIIIIGCFAGIIFSLGGSPENINNQLRVSHEVPTTKVDTIDQQDSEAGSHMSNSVELETGSMRKQLLFTVHEWEESTIAVKGWESRYCTFTAKDGMKFITLKFSIQNNWVEEQTIPFITGKIHTAKGYRYKEWRYPIRGFCSEKPPYFAKDSTSHEIEKFIGKNTELKKRLLPEEKVNKSIVFEIPIEQQEQQINLSYVPKTIILD